MSNRRGPHVIARPRKRPEITTTEIDTNKLAELIAAAPQPPPQPEVKLARATTRAVSDDSMAEIMAQQTRVAPQPPPPAVARLAHTKRRSEPAKRAATEGESFDDPTTIHTRTTGSIPVERSAPRAATVKGADEPAALPRPPTGRSGIVAAARGSVAELPSANDISAAVAMLAAATADAADADEPAIPAPSSDSPTRPSKLADGSAAMIPVDPVDKAPAEIEIATDDLAASPEAPAAIPPMYPQTMKARAIALSGVLAAAVVAGAWWLVH